MRKLVPSLFSLLFTALLCYIGMWQNPESVELDSFLKLNGLSVYDTQEAIPIPEPELENLWEKYESHFRSISYPWPFRWNDELRSLYRKYVWPNREAILWGLCVVVALCIVCVGFIPASRRRKRFLDHLLLELVKQLQLQHTDDIRVTLYVPTRGYRFVFSYLWRTLLCPKRFIVHCRKGLLFYHLRRLPWPSKKYLVPFARYRYGRHHDEILTSTYFHIPDNDQNAKGVVERAWATGFRKARFPALSEEELKTFKKLDHMKKSDKKLHDKVKRYLSAGTLKGDFKLLRSMHRYPRNMLAFALTDEGDQSRQTGVLVLDDSKYEKELNNLDTDTVIQYSRIIQDAVSVFTN